MKILLSFLILITSAFSSDSPTLQRLQKSYNSNLDKYAKAREMRKEQNSQKAFTQLKQLEKTLQKAGKLEALLQVKEITKKGASHLNNIKASQNTAVSAILAALKKGNSQAQITYDANLTKLQKQYISALTSNIRKLIQQNKIEEAISLQAELKKIAKHAPVTKAEVPRPQSPSAPAPVAFDFKTAVIHHKNAKYATLKDLDSGSKEAQELQKLAAKDYPLEFRLKKSTIVFRLIPAGQFTMGSPPFEGGRRNDEKQKPARVEKPFYIGKLEITEKQWKTVMGTAPIWKKGSKHTYPVCKVSWKDSQEFIAKLSTLEGLPAGILKLPDEVNWEFACRAGTKGKFYTGNHFPSPFFGEHYNHFVGKRKCNAFGLYDMHGNVAEWCDDWFAKVHSLKVTRGGAHTGDRSASRGGERIEHQSWNVGLRLAFKIF